MAYAPKLSPAELAAEEHYNMISQQYSHYSLAALACVAFLLFVYRVTIYSIRYVRTLTCLNNDTQRFFANPDGTFAKIKQHLIYSPLFRTRHNREFQLSRAVSAGVLPTRMQSLFVAGLIGMNVLLAVLHLPWSEPWKDVSRYLIIRTGTLAVVNMIPLFLLAGRNNPLIKLCGISYDTMNLCHRWLGRTTVLLAITHMLSWMIPKVQQCKLSTISLTFGQRQY